MSFRVIIASLFITALVSADELPWIGVSLLAPEVENRKAVDLDEGVGLEVTKVVQGSPLASAGGRIGDLWWKFDGQILINKRQMLVLLRTKSPGDTVQIDFYRGKELRSLSLTLVSRERHQFYPVSTRAKGPNVSRFLAKREQVARVTTANQDLTLQREAAGWRFNVIEGGTSVLSSLVTETDLDEKIPPKWHGAFLILKMTLEHQSTPISDSSDRRVRYIPREKSPKE